MGKISLGLEENVAGLLCYALGWITGIVFLIIEKESRFVRFHAMQSTVTFLGFTVFSLLLIPMGFTLFRFIPFIGPLLGFLGWLINIAALITWLVCMLKAYQGEMFKLPLVGGLAERWTTGEGSN